MNKVIFMNSERDLKCPSLVNGKGLCGKKKFDSLRSNSLKSFQKESSRNKHLNVVVVVVVVVDFQAKLQ